MSVFLKYATIVTPIHQALILGSFGFLIGYVLGHEHGEMSNVAGMPPPQRPPAGDGIGLPSVDARLILPSAPATTPVPDTPKPAPAPNALITFPDEAYADTRSPNR